MTKQLTLEENDFGYLFHRILRKSLDSRGSSICWNAIFLLSSEDWALFVIAMYDTVIEGDGVLDRNMCTQVLNNACANPAKNLLKIGLQMLDDEEYKVIDRQVREYTEIEVG